MLKILMTAALVAASATPAIAQAEPVTQSVRVRYADLDLRRAGDVKVLDRRLHAAVRAVCRQDSSVIEGIALGVSACRKEALAAVADKRDAAIEAANAGTQLAMNVSAR